LDSPAQLIVKKKRKKKKDKDTNLMAPNQTSHCVLARATAVHNVWSQVAEALLLLIVAEALLLLMAAEALLLLIVAEALLLLTAAEALALRLVLRQVVVQRQ
jgi:hypothetical protein